MKEKEKDGNANRSNTYNTDDYYHRHQHISFVSIRQSLEIYYHDKKDDDEHYQYPKNMKRINWQFSLALSLIIYSGNCYGDEPRRLLPPPPLQIRRW